MVKKTYISDKKTEELEEIIKQQISIIKGTGITTKNGTIFWNFKYGKQFIECKTFLKETILGTEITTQSENVNKISLGEGVVINKFYNSLLETISIQPKPTQKTNPKPHIQNHSNYSLNKITIIGLVIFTIFIYYFSNKENSTSIDTGSTYITQSGKMGSYNKESMEKLVNCSSHKDYQCIEQLMYSGEIFEIPGGQEAYVIESEFPGKVKIRLKGETQEIWTFIETIKHK